MADQSIGTLVRFVAAHYFNLKCFTVQENRHSLISHWGLNHVSAYPGGIIDCHLCQKFSINAEVAEAASLVADDAMALARHRDEPWALIVVRALQSSQQVPSDGVDQTWTLCQTQTYTDKTKDKRAKCNVLITSNNLWLSVLRDGLLVHLFQWACCLLCTCSGLDLSMSSQNIF